MINTIQFNKNNCYVASFGRVWDGGIFSKLIIKVSEFILRNNKSKDND
jgi:hypothetical protein